MTVTIQQQIEEFKQLSFEVKKEKLLAMLEMIKTSHEYFPQLIEIIKTNAQIDSPRLDGLYQNLVEYGDSLMKNEKDKSFEKLDNIRSIIKNIQEKEATERATENPEDLLKSL